MKAVTKIFGQYFAAILFTNSLAIPVYSTEIPVSSNEFESYVDDDDIVAGQVSDELLNQSTRVKELIQKGRQDKNSSVVKPSLGAIGRLQSRAKKFEQERHKRKLIEVEVAQLIDQLEILFAPPRNSDEKTIGILKDKISLSRKEQRSTPELKSSPADNFRYHTVTEPATLRQISADPNVYDTSDHWILLFNANRDKIDDASQTVRRRERLSLYQ